MAAAPAVQLLRALRPSFSLQTAASAATTVALRAAPPSPLGQTSFSLAPCAVPSTRVWLRSTLDLSRSVSSVSGPGPVDSPLIDSMSQKITEALSAENVSVQDMQGDGRHVSIRVVASVFEGKRSLDRQRMVYKAIWEELQGAVHAVDNLVTLTPEEASK